MNIPDKAVESAREAEHEWNADRRPRLSRVEYMLEAAAPAMYAQALRDYADDLARVVPEGESARLRRLCRIQHIRLRANELDPQ